MTALGATIYGGFFVLAAIWLFLTADGPAGGGQGQRPDRSNSDSTAKDSDGSSPWLASHPSSK